jgi:hypothetical protein
MHAIFLIPANTDSARLTVALGGSEWFEFDAGLAPGMHLRLAGEGRSFPARGTVSIRRGMDHAASGERVVDSFRYIAGCIDDETGEPVPERFGVTLFMAEAAFDRLLQRAHWGLPALALFFDPASEVITAAAAGNADALFFRRQPRSWEQISSVTLTQRPTRGQG